MKRYVIVTPYFPSLGDWRGAYCLDFVKALERKLGAAGGWKVDVFTEGRVDDYEVDGVKVHVFPARRLPSNVMPQLFARANQRSFMDALRRAGIAAGDVAVCHAHVANYGIYALAVKAENARCRTLLHHHCLQSFGLNGGRLRGLWPYNAVQFALLRRMHEAIDVHVFISDLARQSFLAAPDASWTDYEDYRRQMRGLGLCRPAKVRDTIVLHNGVDKRMFNVGEKKPHEGFVIGCVGNFLDMKGQMSLLEAVGLLGTGNGERGTGNGDVKVVFVGSGKERGKCERYAREKGIDAEFRDEVRHEDLPDFYRGLDLFALPSFFEGFGCVYTEAHSCGVPFIACERQGIGEVLPPEERGRWLCRPRDAGDLARKIQGYMENRWVQNLSEDQDIDKLVGAFVDRLQP